MVLSHPHRSGHPTWGMPTVVHKDIEVEMDMGVRVVNPNITMVVEVVLAVSVVLETQRHQETVVSAYNRVSPVHPHTTRVVVEVVVAVEGMVQKVAGDWVVGVVVEERERV